MTSADSRRPFPSTNWSQILSVSDPSHPDFRDRMDRLLRIYWKPVYAYIRTGWRKSIEDAKDSTQAFFAYLLGKGYVSQVRPTGGTFRGYLKLALKHFLIDAARSDLARRPRTGKPILSLDASPAEMARLGPAVAGETPEQAYDREWFRSVLWGAIETLGDELRKEGKEAYFRAFQAYCVDPQVPPATPPTSTFLRGPSSDGPTYDRLAKELGVKKSDVRNYLSHCRARLHQILRERVRDYVATDDDVHPELAEVLRG